MATITHPTGNGYCRDRILRDKPRQIIVKAKVSEQTPPFLRELYRVSCFLL